jgi:transposase-like protein
MSEDTCGHPTKDGAGSPCQNPATDGDSCWIPKHGGDSDDHGKRSTRLEKSVVDNITAHIAEGKSVASATRMETIPPSTFYNWLDKAPEEYDDPTFENAPYAYLVDRFVRARGLGEDAYVQDVLDIARDEADLSTLLSMLKQRYPESWGDVDRGEQAGGVVVNASDPDEYEIDEDTLEVKE